MDCLLLYIKNRFVKMLKSVGLTLLPGKVGIKQKLDKKSNENSKWTIYKRKSKQKIFVDQCQQYDENDFEKDTQEFGQNE